LCCGRPLMLAGRTDAAAKVIEANKKMIEESGCKTLVLSCPICYKIFKEEYGLQDIQVVHYTQFINDLIVSGSMKVEKTEEKLVYHDPCELGRGCNVYIEPRAALSQAGELVKAAKEYDESICCGGSLGSLTLDTRDRAKISESSLDNLLVNSPETIVTACPLCLKTFSEAVSNSKRPIADVAVKDFAEIFS
ncbi:MAG: (Fe-S)-binding protein, partial [Bacteroidales bacterium]|nr:(Fe-S)-binding protein [Bacteroidales bacterium]